MPGLADTSGSDWELEVRDSRRWRKRACGCVTGGNGGDEVGSAQSTFWWNGDRAANVVSEIPSVIRQYATLRAFFDGLWWEVPESTFWDGVHFTTEARRHRDSAGQK